MNANFRFKIPINAACLFLFSLTALQAESASNVTLWDTVSPFADSVSIADRSAWKRVPSDLLTLEADPPKASSDPGYYGREYSFKGDAVVENRSLAAVFWAAQGRVVVYSKAEAGLPISDSASGGRKIFEFAPLEAKPASIAQCKVLRNGA